MSFTDLTRSVHDVFGVELSEYMDQSARGKVWNCYIATSFFPLLPLLPLLLYSFIPFYLRFTYLSLHYHHNYLSPLEGRRLVG